jgi:arylsulfatase A-like enzyme
MKNSNSIMTYILKIIVLTVLCYALEVHEKGCFAQTKKPNIIFILADDLGYGDLGCYGSTKINTPNIDALAKSGIQFTDFYAGSTVCAPSRATLMTGKHTGHTTIRGNGEVPLDKIDSILPQYLKTVGYTNGMVGKWGLGQAGTTGVPEKKGWDFFSGLLHHVEGHYQHPDSAWQMINGSSTKIKIPNQQYSNAWFTAEAKRFIGTQKKNPFFLYVAFTLPHAELVVPDKYMQPYLNADGSSKFEPEVAHQPGQHYGPQTYPKAAYAAMVTQMDDYVGQLVQYLKEKKLADNTIIIFASDNGTHKEGGRNQADVNFFKSSGVLKGTKRDLYEGGIRVPFIVNWKRSANKGKQLNHAGAFWDILPTICEAAGVTTPFTTDGISILPSLMGKPQQRQTHLYWEFYENGYKQAVRKGNWKAIRFYKGTNPVRTELYNLATDVSETNNVAAANAETVAMLEAIMDKEHITSSNPKFQIK